MLTLSRKPGESFLIIVAGVVVGEITIQDSRTRVAIDLPREYVVVRKEIYADQKATSK